MQIRNAHFSTLEAMLSSEEEMVAAGPVASTMGSGMFKIILIMLLISFNYTLILLNTTLISLNYIFREVALR